VVLSIAKIIDFGVQFWMRRSRYAHFEQTAPENNGLQNILVRITVWNTQFRCGEYLFCLIKTLGNLFFARRRDYPDPSRRSEKEPQDGKIIRFS